MYITFCTKMSLNLMIGSFIGIIVATGQVSDTTPGQKAYIALSLIIVFSLLLDNYVRDKSKTFDMIKTIFGPVDLGQSTHKVVKYSIFKFLSLIFFILFLELIKIGSGIYCVYVLAVENIPDAFVNYCLFALLFLESFLGVVIYVVIILGTLFTRNFYPSWICWMSHWYLHNNCNIEVTYDPPRVSLKITQYDPNYEIKCT